MKKLIIIIALIVGCKEKPKESQIIKASGKDSGRWVEVGSDFFSDSIHPNTLYVSRSLVDSVVRDTVFIHDTIYKNKVK